MKSVDDDAPREVAPYIAVGLLPLYDPGGEMNAGMAFAFVGVAAVVTFRRGLDLMTLGAVAVGFIPVALIVVGFSWYRFRVRLTKRPAPPTLFFLRERMSPVVEFARSDAAAWIIMSLEKSRRYHPLWEPPMWTWRDFLEMVERRGCKRPRTIVDEMSAAQLRTVPLPNHLLEPEAILSGSDQSRASTISVIGIAIGLTVLLLFLNVGWFALFPLAFAALVALQLPKVRDLLRTFHLHQSETVVGLGAITDIAGRQWTVDNAVMLVQCKRIAGPLIVTLVGEQGHVTMPFTDEDDPEFVRLWQRWNHPQPRPDLLPSG